MDFSNKTPILFFLLACACCISGVKLLVPVNLRTSLLEKEVIVLWSRPTDAPSDAHYNVQFKRYVETAWTEVKKCTKITRTFCDISDLITDYGSAYVVRVQLEARSTQSEWATKKILPNSCELQPPSFTMWATSSTLKVHIHHKPVLNELFPFGITYTISLNETSQNKTTVAALGDEAWSHQNEKVFTSLLWGREYCVTVKVEGNGGLSIQSSLSPPQCLVLPQQEWIIIGVASLTVSGCLLVAAFIIGFVLCYIKRPAKTPAVLKSPVTGWLPLSFGEGPIEVVTDRGWFLYKADAEAHHRVQSVPVTYDPDQRSDDEDRRPSTDSGVSMKSNMDPTARDDGSCGGTELRDGVGSDFPIEDQSDALSIVKGEDSGTGLSCHSDTSSFNLEEQDSGCLEKPGGYHSQKVYESEFISKERLQESQLVSVVPGYRTNAPLCTCSGANPCVLCLNQSNYRGKCKGLLQNQTVAVSHSGYRSNNLTDKMNLTAQMEQTFPMLTSLSSFAGMEKGWDLNMNDVSLSLRDVEINIY